jgi:hypothetical protein
MPKNLRYLPIVGSFLTMLLTLPCISQAGGLYLNEFGTPSMGVAGAGANAVASDASTSFHNPAGMTRIKGRELMGTAGLLNSTVKFDPDPDTPVAGSDGGDAGGLAPIIGGFYVHSLSDRWKLGANLLTLTGAVLDYDDDWTGRYLNTEVTLLTMTFAPSIAYRVNDWLSLGAAAEIMYAELEMKAKAPLPGPGGAEGEVKIDGNDVAFGFGLGALFELSERTRFGLVYQSEGCRLRPIPPSHWRSSSGCPLIMSSTTSGHCSEPWVGKTGARLKMSTFRPIVAQGISHVTGKIPGNSPLGCITVRLKNGCCSSVWPMTPRRWILMIARLTCLSTVRFDMPPGFNTNGATDYPPAPNLFMPTMARPK